MQIVIDTNVIVSAFLNPKGNTAIFMDKVFGGCYDIIVTETILMEYDDVLHRSKFHFKESTIKYIISWFRNYGIMIEVDENDYPKDLMVDEKDAPFYVAARCTKSRLVTGNIKHYPVEEMRTMLWELL
jgi:putative PIN family toxin of toxin-antitoxin system